MSKTSSGKIQRVLCRELHSRGELDRVVQGRSSRANPLADKNADTNATRPKDGLRVADTSVALSTAEGAPASETAKVVLNDVVPVSASSIVTLIEAWLVANKLNAPSESTQTFAELGVDSIGVVELADYLQEQLQIEVDHTVVYDYPTLHMLAGFVFSKYVANNDPPNALIDELGIEEIPRCRAGSVVASLEGDTTNRFVNIV